MILYLDTSALVKLYVPEPDSALSNNRLMLPSCLQRHASLMSKPEPPLRASAENEQ